MEESINHVENILKQDIDQTWEHAVQNEQYSRKNNIPLLGFEEEPSESLESKFIQCMKENSGGDNSRGNRDYTPNWIAQNK